MSKSIRINRRELADIMMIILLDSIRGNAGALNESPEYEEFIKFLDSRGLKPMLYNDYIKLNADTRVKYNLIKDIFEPDAEFGTTTIFILEDKPKVKLSKEVVSIIKNPVKYVKKKLTEEGEIIEEECDGIPFDEGHRELCKKIFRKIKEVRFKQSMPMTEDRIDKIIDYVVQKEKGKNG